MCGRLLDEVLRFQMSCLHVRNLPPHALELDVQRILAGARVRVRTVDVLLDPERRHCRGEAYAQLDSVDDCYRAVRLLHDSVRFDGRPLQFVPVAHRHLMQVVEYYLATTTSRKPPPAPFDSDPPPPEKRARHHDDLWPASAGPNTAISPLSPVCSPTPSQHSSSGAASSHQSPVSYERQYGFAPAPSAAHNESSASLTGGSSVKMCNLSRDVTQEDIMDFFRQFAPIQQSILLVYDGRRQFIGEGFLTFPTAEAAQGAVKTLDGKTLLRDQVQLILHH